MQQIALMGKFEEEKKKFDKTDQAHSALLFFNGSISRNGVNASCARGASFPLNPKYDPSRFLQVNIVTLNQAMSGHAAEHLSQTAQAVAGYYLWSLIVDARFGHLQAVSSGALIPDPFIRRH